MIVYGMNEKEIEKEVFDDLENVSRYQNNNQNKFRRLVIKSSHFPVYNNNIYISPKKNKWIVLLEAQNKKEVGGKSQVTLIVTYDTPRGIHAISISPIKGKLRLCFHPPHFFKRFRDRATITKNGIELIVEFFRINSNYVLDMVGKMTTNDTYHVQIAGSTKSGVSLGLLTAGENFHFKTFITYDMLKGEQIDKYIKNEEIRKEIEELL